MTDSRRELPSVTALLETDHVRALLATNPRSVIVNAIRQTLETVRNLEREPGEAMDWNSAIDANVELVGHSSLRSVFNATGVVLHTNLGRAPLADCAIDAIVAMAGGFTNLEYDLGEARRGSRYVHCVSLLKELTGAEDAIVVNNCAAALVLTLSALARDRETIVSRGELVEIGGSFRVPDIMQRSGSQLVEIGTTNRTHVNDYRRAITPRTGAIAKIHRSNFTQSGFVADADVRSLAAIAREHGVPIIHDLGSGLLVDLSEYGLGGEPTARTALDAGATLVLMSGDKLLGGPQAGIIIGAADAVARLRKDPFARAMRVDKMTIAALSATLALYREPDRALLEIPALQMITATAASVRLRCAAVVETLVTAGIAAHVVDSNASVGAGAFPTTEIPSAAIAIDGDARSLELALRRGRAPVIARIADDSVLLDMRSVPTRDDAAFARAVTGALQVE
ncbi:MAG: L-seryl-tRNA(Sec) selenium transferase [Gemmatimonadaceae bacterium]